MKNGFFEKSKFIFDSNTDRMVMDHNMLGELLLPGAAYIDVALAGMDGYCLLKLSNVYLYSPLIFKHGEVKVLYLNWGKDRESQKFSITSGVNEGETVKHSEGSIVKVENRELGMLNLDTIRYRCLRKLSSEGYYKLFDDVGMKYGEYYRNIEKIIYNDIEVLSTIVLGKEALRFKGHYFVHPAVMDCMFQSVGIFSFVNNSPYVHVPFYIESMLLKRMPSNICYCYGRVREDNNEVSSVLKYDFSICDENGDIYLDLSNLYLKRIKNRAT